MKLADGSPFERERPFSHLSDRMSGVFPVPVYGRSGAIEMYMKIDHFGFSSCPGFQGTKKRPLTPTSQNCSFHSVLARGYFLHYCQIIV